MIQYLFEKGRDMTIQKETQDELRNALQQALTLNTDSKAELKASEQLLGQLNSIGPLLEGQAAQQLHQGLNGAMFQIRTDAQTEKLQQRATSIFGKQADPEADNTSSFSKH
jgi:hypothetical protein